MIPTKNNRLIEIALEAKGIADKYYNGEVKGFVLEFIKLVRRNELAVAPNTKIWNVVLTKDILKAGKIAGYNSSEIRRALKILLINGFIYCPYFKKEKKGLYCLGYKEV